MKPMASLRARAASDVPPTRGNRPAALPPPPGTRPAALQPPPPLRRRSGMNPIPRWAAPMVEQVLARYGDRFLGRDDRSPEGSLIEEVAGRGTLPPLRAAARSDLGIPEIAPAEAPQPAG